MSAELLLIVIVGFLWAVLVAIKKCLVELSNIAARLEVANGLIVNSMDKIEAVSVGVDSNDLKLRNIEEAVGYFYDAAVSARGGR